MKKNVGETVAHTFTSAANALRADIENSNHERDVAAERIAKAVEEMDTASDRGNIDAYKAAHMKKVEAEATRDFYTKRAKALENKKVLPEDQILKLKKQITDEVARLEKEAGETLFPSLAAVMKKAQEYDAELSALQILIGALEANTLEYPTRAYHSPHVLNLFFSIEQLPDYRNHTGMRDNLMLQNALNARRDEARHRLGI